MWALPGTACRLLQNDITHQGILISAELLPRASVQLASRFKTLEMCTEEVLMMLSESFVQNPAGPSQQL